MYNNRITFGIDNFIEKDYFLPMENYYELKETIKQGESLLKLTVEGDNICVERFDDKKRCGFLRNEKKLGMQKCIDHFVLKRSDDFWDLYMIEMKTSVGDKTWKEIKAKMRSSLLNIKALSEFLGITIEKTYAYTTYEKEAFTKPEDTSNPKALVTPIGEKAINFKRDEWDKNIIKIKIDEYIIFPHKSIKMDRDSKGVLQGTLTI